MSFTLKAPVVVFPFEERDQIWVLRSALLLTLETPGVSVLCLSPVVNGSARVAEGASDHENSPGRGQHGQGSPSARD